VLMLGAAFYFFKDRWSLRRNPALGWVVIGLIVVIAGFPIQQTYLRDRYIGTPGTALPTWSDWFQHKSNIRVGVIGEFAYLQYPFYGKNLSNYVQYLGIRGIHGSYSTFGTCHAWRDVVGNGQYSYVVITTDVVTRKSALASATPPEVRWMKTSKDSKVVLRGQFPTAPPFPGYLGYVLYKVGPHFSDDACRG
jgi:hypothetical protein